MACFTAINSFLVPFLLFARLAFVAGFVQALNSPSDLLNGGFNSMNVPIVGRQGSDEVWDVVVSPPAAGAGLGACWTRSLAFKDARGQALQICCGAYTESVLQELDLVFSEARRNGNRLILCLRLYVRRPTDPGVDAFHTNRVVISEFKKQIKTVLTRINILTGVAYRDEPAIMGLKLIVSLHPHGGPQDPNSGKLSFSGWIQNMESFVKSIDRNHLLTMGVEENGGSNMPPKKAMNPRYQRRFHRDDDDPNYFVMARFLSHEESPPSSLVEVSHVKAEVPPSQPSGCTNIPTNATGHCPNH